MKLVCMLLLAGALVGCGESKLDRGARGAAIGAGAGAAGGALTGNSATGGPCSEARRVC
jgi:hypothetical protein